LLNDPIKQPPKHSPRKPKNESWEGVVPKLDGVQDEIERGNLTEAQWAEYTEWRKRLGKKMFRRAHEELEAFAKNLVGINFKLTKDTNAQVIVDPPALRLAEPGAADIVNARPFLTRITFLIDKSGSMGEQYNDKLARYEWAQTVIMLFLDAIIDINAAYNNPATISGGKVFEWRIALFDGKAIDISDGFPGSRTVTKAQKHSYIYHTLKKIVPGGSTDDRHAFEAILASQLDEKKDNPQEIIDAVMAIGDGNEGTNDFIKKLKVAQNKDEINTFVIPVGDEKSIASTKISYGKFAIYADSLQKYPPKIWDAFLQLLYDKSGLDRSQMPAYLAERSDNEIDVELKRVFSDVRGDNYHFLENWARGHSVEGRSGRLLETLSWKDSLNKLLVWFPDSCGRPS
jgi:hypothetical protein